MVRFSKAVSNTFECVHQYLQERKNLHGDIQQLKSDALVQTQDNDRLEHLLARVQEDKKKLSERVNKLTANGTV